MITDNETSFVYLSELTKTDFTDIAKALTDFLKKAGVGYGFLKQTEDYFCRDYMPVQVTKEKFVQFVYNPIAYFKLDELEYISNPVKIQINNKLARPYYSRLILDGGNVVKGETKVIITDKVIRDNVYMMPKKKIIKELETLLEAEVIIIPTIKSEATGHADGMIRFIDDDTVLINELGYDDRWEERFLAVLKKYGLKYEQLYIFEDKPGSGIGIYINYLHVSNLIVVPFFDHPEQKNEDVLKRMEELFTDCTVKHVDATSLAEHGGILNCATWNILK